MVKPKPVKKIRSYTLGGTTWRVKHHKKMGKLFGLCDPSETTIHLCVGTPDSPNSADNIESTFYHEVTHSILFQMGELELYGNERFIDTFSSFLLQALKTTKVK